MQKYLCIYAALATVALWWCLSRYPAENRRLEQNIMALTATCETYRTTAGHAEAEVQILRLRTAEFEELRREDARRIRSMGIRLKRLEASATTTLATTVESRAPIVDTIIIYTQDTVVVHDTVQVFRWYDPWVEVEGTIRRDSVECRVSSTDTLCQVVHRIPRRFLFFRWGTKALRQTVTSSNPHTRIVATEYIRIEK